MGFENDKQKCLDCLEHSLGKLGIVANDTSDLMIADLIIESMTGQRRVFHNPDHIFQVGAGGDAIEVISALFHDTVYVQVDQGISAGVLNFIAPFIREVDGELFIATDPDLAKDSSFNLCLMAFGFEFGQALTPTAGQNEFLSALFAAKVLEGILAAPVLTQIIACIEATIPFRKRDDQGISASTQLYSNLKKINTVYMFSWDDDEIQEIIKKGVRLANRDIAGFTSENPSQFLDDTWKLIPETNPDLRLTNACDMVSYRKALQKMGAFLKSIQAEDVISQYQNEPSDEEFARLLFFVNRNLDIANAYFDINLLSIAVLEALSSDSMIENSIKAIAKEPPEDGLITSTPQPSVFTDIDRAVLSLLEQKRVPDLTCDRINFPLAAHIRKSMSAIDSQHLLSQAGLFFSGALSPENFLNQCPSHLIHTGIDSVRQRLSLCP